LPTPGQYDVELVLQSDAPPEQMLETADLFLPPDGRAASSCMLIQI